MLNKTGYIVENIVRRDLRIEKSQLGVIGDIMISIFFLNQIKNNIALIAEFNGLLIVSVAQPSK